MKVLSLDGGGAKGFYTLGVLRELELAAGTNLANVFDLIYGTSTGSIIASLLALGRTVDEVHGTYAENVLKIVSPFLPSARSAALAEVGEEVFRDLRFDSFITGVGIVATRWLDERPLIFKNEVSRAAGRKSSFVSGFGCSISDAVQASSSAYPLFNRKKIRLHNGDELELIDGGYCANNPSLYALADAVSITGTAPEDVRLLSVGVGEYPEPFRPRLRSFLQRLPTVRLLNKTLQINTLSMAQLMQVLFPTVEIVRVSDVFAEPEMATDLFENSLPKLNRLRQQGAQSYANKETAILKLLEFQK